MQRSKPNILITGTPGTGKTTTCQQVVEAIGFTHINIGDWVKEQELHSGWDDEHGCYTIDEDKVRGPSCGSCMAGKAFMLCKVLLTVCGL